jgi:hypothetical protein
MRAWVLRTTVGACFLAGSCGCLRAQDLSWPSEAVDGEHASPDVRLSSWLRADPREGPIAHVASEAASPRSGLAEMTATGDRALQAETGAPQGPDSGAPGGSDLASDFTNPTKLLTSFQFNTWYHPNFYGARGSGTEFMVRPVVPVPKSSLIPVDQIVRIGLPVESMPFLPDGRDLPDGFMDVQAFDLAIFPVSRDLTLAAGAIAILPTATSPVTGQGRWQLGPAFAGVYTGIPKWQIGLLLQNPISIGTSDRPSVNQMFYNLILTRHFEKGWYGSLFGASGTTDWRRGQWTVPASFTVGRVFPVGKQPVNFSVTPAYYANGPELTPKFEMEFNFALIYR